MKFTICRAWLLPVAMLSACSSGGVKTANNHYQTYCAACHGDDLAGGAGTSLIDGQWNHGATDEDLARVIHDGLPDLGMPPFGSVLSDRDIRAMVDLIRVRADRRQPAGGMAGVTIEAETLDPRQSGAFRISTAEFDPKRQYVGHFSAGSYICYDDIDLTGVNSIRFEYAQGPEAYGTCRVAILARKRGVASSRINLGEKIIPGTGGWETFQTIDAGLSRRFDGPHRLCFWGLDGGGIFNLDKFTLSDRPGRNDGITEPFSVPVAEVLSAAGHSFTPEFVADAPGILWAMDFLPDGTIVATQKNGQLWLFRDGERLGPVEGLPEVRDMGQGGLLAVKRHPDYADNGWLYLTYSDPGANGAMTAVARGRLDDLRWVNEETIYKAPERFYTDSAAHFGSRLVFRDGYVYFTVGERNHREFAQDLSYPIGKVHRLHDDGRVPDDNPFAADAKAIASVWSYGHRNPQGLTVQPGTGAIWAAEHGPRGGDELNVVQKGLNYGWPLVSLGINYDGTIISNQAHEEAGMEPPKHHWTPSIAVSDIEFYTGDRFPRWRDHLLAGSLGSEELHMVRIDGDRVIGDELLLKGMGRIRDVADGPDGYPYLILNNPNGMIYRLVPASGQ